MEQPLNSLPLNEPLYKSLLNLSHNELRILDALFQQGPQSRKNLAQITQLTGASTTRLSKKFIELGLIKELVEYQGSVGNPTRPLHIIGEGAITLGVSFDKHHIEYTFANLVGKIVHHGEIKAEGITINSLVVVLSEALNDMSKRYPIERLIGIGLAIPGYHAIDKGKWAIHWDFPDLLKHDIATELEQQLKVPVYAERDAITAGWAEHIYNNDLPADFFYIYLGQGVGGSLFTAGKPYRGVNGNAGGIGAMFHYDKFRPSMNDLADYCEENNINITNLSDISEQHFQQITPWLIEACSSLKQELDLIVRLYDPGTLVIGGLLDKKILNYLSENIAYTKVSTNYNDEIAAVNINSAQMVEHSLSFGASCLPLAALLSR